MTEQEWIDNQGGCCICAERATHADNMDNVFCEEHALKDMAECPEDWNEEDDEDLFGDL